MSGTLTAGVDYDLALPTHARMHDEAMHARMHDEAMPPGGRVITLGETSVPCYLMLLGEVSA